MLSGLINTISVLKYRFKTEDAYRVRKSARMRICSLMRFRTACGLLKHTHQRWACFKTESVSVPGVSQGQSWRAGSTQRGRFSSLKRVETWEKRPLCPSRMLAMCFSLLGVIRCFPKPMGLGRTVPGVSVRQKEPSPVSHF